MGSFPLSMRGPTTCAAFARAGQWVVFVMDNPMPDDRKHPNRVPVYLTDQEFFDLSRAATAMDKALGEYIRFVLRRDMYGTVGLQSRHEKQSQSAFAARD